MELFWLLAQDSLQYRHLRLSDVRCGSHWYCWGRAGSCLLNTVWPRSLTQISCRYLQIVCWVGLEPAFVFHCTQTTLFQANEKCHQQEQSQQSGAIQQSFPGRLPGRHVGDVNIRSQICPDLRGLKLKHGTFLTEGTVNGHSELFKIPIFI